MKEKLKKKLFYFHQIWLKLLNRSKSQIFRGFSNLVSDRVAQSVNLLLNQKGQQVSLPDLKTVIVVQILFLRISSFSIFVRLVRMSCAYSELWIARDHSFANFWILELVYSADRSCSVSMTSVLTEALEFGGSAWLASKTLCKVLKQLFKTFYWTKKKLKKYREIIKFIKREQVYIFAYHL